ncbi:PLP-dependent transferase [Jatrophihabitans telluris]|uniref:PLP-dependent transferase n=1 Tax=Jatrophihabitans telluris TaxID=2038343 RepID=A0ABY4R118_9ACTN|nr:PLP-dependent transferase [Jatrophihabitans telluris]UQX88941.1 PLP-dependent transferase [Jatrophihabitans telluris]
MTPRHPLRPESVIVAAGRPAHEPGAPVNAPVVLTATFHAGSARGYARDGQDTTVAFETAMAAAEGAPDGDRDGASIAFSSGMAAAAAVIESLPVGAVVVAPASYYNFHRNLLDEQVRLGRITVRTVDQTDTAAVVAALDGATLAWLELPTNPLLQVLDLPAVATAARARGVRTVVDATVATPLGLRPLDHGADVVMHSATKWIAGHSDLLMGVLSTSDPALAEQLRQRRTLTGAVPGALEGYLALRGLRTLSVRLERACDSTAVLARRLAEHPAVTGVHYLGDPDHPQASLIAQLLTHRGALLSFTTDTLARADAVCSRVGLITHATSIGGVESLIERRGAYAGEAAQGTPAELVRLSVGIEHVEDLWADLAQALA